MVQGIRLKLVVFTVALVLSGAAFVRAEEPEGMEKGACKADVQKLCPGVAPGYGDIHGCMKAHELELSEGCKSHIALMKEKHRMARKEMKAACHADEQQFCKDITPGEGREMSCLRAHSDKISAGCKDVIKKHHRKMKSHAHAGAPAPVPAPPQN